MNAILSFIQRIAGIESGKNENLLFEEMIICEEKLKKFPHTQDFVKTMRLFFQKVLEKEKMDETHKELNIIKKSISSHTDIIKRFLSETDQLLELQKNIDVSFSSTRVIWQHLKNLDYIVSQLLKEKSIHEYKEWKSKIENDFNVYKNMKLGELEKKKLDYDTELRKFVQERMQLENTEFKLCLESEKTSRNLEEELKKIELPLISNELDSFFEESEGFDEINLKVLEKK
ncbi:hypothetical protein PORY_001262 [Pneumocystis oryctolagi]|uniref:Uncharacterized protein n=1 Tax=Pneumocystis oryctolagi TaxID=42067 RepID=A0ACB7CDD9_9ASCO|nr:hypothetical protein PORY_001262 [Pneumocystis oryctolagi]